MNRTTSLFLALGILLAHALAVHQTETGGFAGAHDEAHVAYRVAHQLFDDGIASWNSSSPSFDAYPSPLWILISWIPERLYRDPSRFCQLIGLVCALSTAIVISRFSRDRLAGIIAPFLLVFSGGFAAASTSGTETSMLALAMTLGFLSLERQRPRMLALSLLIVAITRPEGELFVGAIWLMSWLSGRKKAHPNSRAMQLAVLPAVIAVLVIALMRHSITGHWLSPTAAAMSEWDSERWLLGSSYLSDFLLKSGSGFLVIFPVAALFTGALKGMAARGFALVLLWFSIVAWTGGSSAPFWLAIVPILPILFVTIQESMTAVMDSERVGFAPATWAAFTIALVLSAMVSKKPGNIGSIALADSHFAAMEASPRVSTAYHNFHGRESVRSANRNSARLREIGFFLRKELGEEFDIVTPWPGSIGYHSRRKVIDLLGRTNIAPGKTQLMPWTGFEKIDLAAQLKERPDHLLLSFKTYLMLPSAREMLSEWLEEWDIIGDTPERRKTLIRELSQYELVTIPIRYESGDSVLGRLAPFFLLRHAEADLAPVLSISKSGDRTIEVTVEHRGYVVIADLEVIVIDSEGAQWSLRPTGKLTREREVNARHGLLLSKAGDRPIRLIEVELPDAFQAVEIVAALRNPGTEKTFALSLVGEEARLKLGTAAND